MLTARQERFVAEYLVDLNASAAARRAGYSAKTARFIGAENLTKPNIRAALSAAQTARLRRIQMTSAATLEEIGVVAGSNIAECFGADGRLRPITELPERVQRAVASVKVRTVDGKESVTEIKLWPKLPALEQLGKHYGLLRERTETEQHGEVHVHHHYANLDEDDGAAAGTG